MSILEVKNLSVGFQTPRGNLDAVKSISFQLNKGETLGIVGESGSGKSVTSLALMRLLPPNATITADSMNFLGKDLTALSESQMQSLRGGDMAMIFQDPMTSLNPCFSVGFQLMEALKVHQPELSKERRTQKSIDLLRSAGIPSPEIRMKSFPHQLSGGMSQRVMIAMAIACQPKLLIADEPTTALDVTIQAQILQLLDALSHEEEMSMILITHDIGVVAEYTDRMLVMYAGQVVEEGKTQDIIDNPSHPYTKALLDSLPGHFTENQHRQKLYTIPGLVPDLTNRPKGCQMHPRCAYVQEKCRTVMPDLEAVDDRGVRCFYPLTKGES
jgi:dipeptide transport system ATP-binding protein